MSGLMGTVNYRFGTPWVTQLFGGAIEIPMFQTLRYDTTPHHEINQL